MASARAEQAALRLRRLGLHRVVLLSGGIEAWQSAGLTPGSCTRPMTGAAASRLGQAAAGMAGPR